jgi:hypothetical protein
MHIHKISSNFKEHQNFLAQNRKDPITGNSILENDDVCFCAGCKSVFLIYLFICKLGQTHENKICNFITFWSIFLVLKFKRGCLN